MQGTMERIENRPDESQAKAIMRLDKIVAQIDEMANRLRESGVLCRSFADSLLGEEPQAEGPSLGPEGQNGSMVNRLGEAAERLNGVVAMVEHEIGRL